MAKAKKVRCIETGEVYNSGKEAERKLGLSENAVYKVLRGSSKTAKGYHFEYVEEETEEEPEQMYLITTNEQGEPIPVIDSREVARMMDIPHSRVLDYIEGNESNGVVSIAKAIAKRGTAIDSYFIPSTYLVNNKECKCYLCTKKGCELLGNRQQGEKGILFNIAYVERFNEMEEELKSKSVHQYPELAREDELILSVVKGATPLDRVTALQELTALITDKATAPLKAELTQTKSELNDKTEFIDDINDCFPISQIVQYNKQLLKDRKDIVICPAKLNRIASELNTPVNKIDNPIVYSPYRRVNAYPRKVWEKAYPDIKLPEKKSKKLPEKESK